MDDLSALKGFRAEREAEPPEAREAVWLALAARIDAAAELAAPPSLGRARHRRLFALGGGIALSAMVAGAVLWNSGPTAQPTAAAAVLHEAAAAAASGDAPATLIPGPGQFLYRREQRLEVQGWLHPLPPPPPDRPVSTMNGTMTGPDSLNALVSTTVQTWTAPDGGGRRREELGPVRFWSPREAARWKAAGSPLPPPFSGEYQSLYETGDDGALAMKPGLVDRELPGYGDYRFPDTSRLPTDPAALRAAVEANEIEVTGFNSMFPKADRLDSEQTKEELVNILFEGTPSSDLQAAIFNALAEVPGVSVDMTAVDGLGRRGDALSFQPSGGIRSDYIFDPATGAVLGIREILVDPAASDTFGELPAGTTVGERDFLEAGLVDSTEATAHR